MAVASYWTTTLYEMLGMACRLRRAAAHDCWSIKFQSMGHAARITRRRAVTIERIPCLSNTLLHTAARRITAFSSFSPTYFVVVAAQSCPQHRDLWVRSACFAAGDIPGRGMEDEGPRRGRECEKKIHTDKGRDNYPAFLSSCIHSPSCHALKLMDGIS
jgi:hypothetical protein